MRLLKQRWTPPLLLFCVVSNLSGCFRTPPPPIGSRAAAQEELIRICREEYKYDIVVKQTNQTVWIYVPLKDNIIDFKAAPKSPFISTAKKTWSIQRLESVYKDKTFVIDYDIAPTKKYQKDSGYQTTYSEEYNEKQRHLISAITRAYFDVGTVPGDVTYADAQKNKTHSDLVNAYVKTDAPPEFFVVVYADIKRGIITKTISFFDDMKRALSNPPDITSEEYAKRYLYEIAGDEAFIGDQTGEHLKIEEIHLPDFLAKQIANRINFQFLQSSFPPSEDIEKEILTIVAETTRLYKFNDFTAVKLRDQLNDKEYLFDKSQLATFSK